MDHGKLTDHHGKTVDFPNCILIMTTNAGAAVHGTRKRRIRRPRRREDAQEDAVKKMFTPEFRNRLDAIVPLPTCRRQWSRGWSTSSSSARASTCRPQRPHRTRRRSARMAHQSRLRQALRCPPDGPPHPGEDQATARRELLFGKLVNGGEVKVRIKDNAPSFEIVPAAPKAAKAKPKKSALKKKTGEAPAAE